MFILIFFAFVLPVCVYVNCLTNSNILLYTNLYDMLLMYETMPTYLPCILLVRLRHGLDSTVASVPFVVNLSFIILSVDYIE